MLRKARSAMGLATDTIQARVADAARADAADRYDGADMRVWGGGGWSGAGGGGEKGFHHRVKGDNDRHMSPQLRNHMARGAFNW